MNEETIKNELQKYGVTDAAIAKLNTDYMALTVKSANDNAGYEVVKKARIDIKKRRVEVEKTRVVLKAESLEYGRRVDGEAKRITALLEPIETHLIAQEKIVDDEKARLKAEAEAKEADRVQARIDRLESMGMGLIAGHYKLPYGVEGVAVPVAILKVCTDEQFAQFVAQIQEKKDAEDARVKAEEQQRLEEQALILKVQQEQEAERQRLESEQMRLKMEEDNRLRAAVEEERKARIKERLETEEREKKEKAIRDEAERVRKEKEEWEAIKAQEQRDIAAAKQKVFDDAKHAQELEVARKESAEKARLQAIEDARRAAEAHTALRETQRIAAEKKAARAPDKVKILLIADVLDSIQTPDVKTDDGKAVALSIMMSIAALVKTIRDEVEEL